MVPLAALFIRYFIRWRYGLRCSLSSNDYAYLCARLRNNPAHEDDVFVPLKWTSQALRILVSALRPLPRHIVRGAAVKVYKRAPAVRVYMYSLDENAGPPRRWDLGPRKYTLTTRFRSEPGDSNQGCSYIGFRVDWFGEAEPKNSLPLNSSRREMRIVRLREAVLTKIVAELDDRLMSKKETTKLSSAGRQWREALKRSGKWPQTSAQTEVPFLFSEIYKATITAYYLDRDHLERTEPYLFNYAVWLDAQVRAL